eukprot:435332-Rhodomonas_salina.1
MRCPVLIHRKLLPGSDTRAFYPARGQVQYAICLRTPCAMRGTDVAYGGTRSAATATTAAVTTGQNLLNLQR